MARQRLGVRFHGALRDAGPGHAFAGTIADLLRCLPHYDVVVESNGFGIFKADGWLLEELALHFVGAGVDNPRAHALAALGHMLSTADEPRRIDRWVNTPDEWPTRQETDELWKVA